LVGLSKQYSEGCFRFNKYLVAVSGLMIYGIILELSQFYIPGREFEWMDVMANFVGVIFGRWMFHLVYGTGMKKSF
jgi:VanZ family protein